MALLRCPRGHTVALETECLNPPRTLTLEPERSVAVGKFNIDQNKRAPQGYRHPSRANLFRKSTLYYEPFIMNTLQSKSKSKSSLMNSLRNFAEEGSAASE